VSDRYIDIRPSDRVELDLLAREILLDATRETIAGDVDEALADLAETVEFGHLDDVAEKMRDAIRNGSSKRGEFARTPPNGISRLVDELGRRGWEILAPDRAREVRRVLTVFNIMKERLLSNHLSSGKTRRRPRAERPKEG
jgi:hypothetical protein